MSESIRKVTVNVPIALLDTAKKLTGAGITETIIEGLYEIEKRAKRRALAELKGRVKVELDLEGTRK